MRDRSVIIASVLSFVLDRNVLQFKGLGILPFFRTVYKSYCLKSSSLSTFLFAWLFCVKRSTSSVANFLTFPHAILRKPRLRLSSCRPADYELQYRTTPATGNGVSGALQRMPISCSALKKLISEFGFPHHEQTRAAHWMLLKGSPNCSFVMLGDLSVTGLLMVMKISDFHFGPLCCVILYIWLFCLVL